MTVKVIVPVHGQHYSVDLDENPPLGWRFWTFAGFARDPLEPRPYGGSRGIPLVMMKLGDAERWLTAMELDGSAQLFTPHELFPCDHQDGASEFGKAWIAGHAAQPSLFDTVGAAP